MSFSFPGVGIDTNFNGVENGGLFSRDQCRQLAKKIIEAYDGDNDGIVQSIEVAKWLCDCYRAMNKQFKPTATDIASYVQVIDRNRNEFIVNHFLRQGN